MCQCQSKLRSRTAVVRRKALWGMGALITFKYFECEMKRSMVDLIQRSAHSKRPSLGMRMIDPFVNATATRVTLQTNRSTLKNMKRITSTSQLNPMMKPVR